MTEAVGNNSEFATGDTRLKVTVGTVVRGVIPAEPVTVVAAKWHGTAALTLTYRDPLGRVGERLVARVLRFDDYGFEDR